MNDAQLAIIMEILILDVDVYTKIIISQKYSPVPDVETDVWSTLAKDRERQLYGGQRRNRAWTNFGASQGRKGKLLPECMLQIPAIVNHHIMLHAEYAIRANCASGMDISYTI